MGRLTTSASQLSEPGRSHAQGENVVPRKKARLHPQLPSPPVGVRAVQDLEDVPSAEAQLRGVLGQEVKLGLDKRWLLGLRGKKVERNVGSY